MTAVLELEDVVLRYGERAALDGLSLSVQRGEVLAVLGPSGSGKTSIIRALLGFEIPQSGTIKLDGYIASVAGISRIVPEERGLAVVFQDLALWPHLTVAEHLSFGLESRGMESDEISGRVGAMLQQVALANRADSYPAELSGGEQRRVSIARALVLEPRAVLLDEPLANLDPMLRDELLQLFHGLLKGRGITALYVTHDLREVATLADRAAIIERGRVVQTGTLAALREGPANAFVRRLLADVESKAESSRRRGAQLWNATIKG